jgi:uncharacterized membrane protein
MALAIVVSVALQFSLPNRHVLSPSFLLPAAEVLLLIVLLIGDPGRIDRRSLVLRRVMLALLVVMSIDNIAAVVQLVTAILDNDPEETATVLLATGAAIWLTNIIAFSLWYWILDRGGPAERAVDGGRAPSFVFGEMQNPEYADDDWVPIYADYLYLAFTNATAFSPTDTLPVRRWAKMAMMVQSALSLVIAVMIIARAVNILA